MVKLFLWKKENLYQKNNVKGFEPISYTKMLSVVSGEKMCQGIGGLDSIDCFTAV